MVFRFRMISNEVDGFFRDFEIRDIQNFYDFHKIIQEELDYDTSQLASFFISNKDWEKGMELTLLDMSDPDGQYGNSAAMEDVRLAEFVTKKKQHLLYVYDFFTERMFFLELVEVREDDTDKKYPVCIERRGDPPPQIMIQDGDIDMDELTDL